MARFVFVSGDLSGMNYLLPVYRKLESLGHSIIWFADPDGNGIKILKEKFIPHVTEMSEDDIRKLAVDHVFVVNTCASATKAAEKVLDVKFNIRQRFPLVLSANGFFDHCLPKWREKIADYWLAIDEGHAQAIREIRVTDIDPESVLVVGQPAFDSALDYIPRKQAVRNNVRRNLGISENEKVILWWSTGMLEVIYEDVCMLLHGLDYLAGFTDKYRFSLVPRIHSKLN